MSDSVMLGTYRGIVVQNNDPASGARVTLKVPQILGDAESNWAVPSTPTSIIPAVGDQLWVSFEGGDVNAPLYTPPGLLQLTEAVEGLDGTSFTGSPPKPPSALTASTATVVSPEGVTQCVVGLQWTAPTENQDGSVPIKRLNGYRVQYSYDGTNWAGGAFTPETSWLLDGLQPSTLVHLRVQSLSGTSGPGLWATVDETTEAVAGPTVPSAPTLAPEINGVRVRWDGNNAAGADMPAQFSHVEIQRAPTAGFGAVVAVGTLKGEGDFFDASAGAGTTYYYRLVGVSLASEKSTPSTAPSAAGFVDPLFADQAADITALQDSLTGVQGKVDGKSTVYVQSADPNTPSGTLTAADTGDIWINDGSTPRTVQTWTGTAWIEADSRTASTLSTVNTKVTTFYAASSATPSATAVGDLWVVTDDNNRLKRASATGAANWVFIDDLRVAQNAVNLTNYQALVSGPGGLLDGKSTVYYQTTDPNSPATFTATNEGDMWVNSSTAKTKVFQWSGGPGAWVDVTNQQAIDAAAAATTAQAAAEKSDALNTNPSFSDWTGTVPNAWLAFGTAPTKEVGASAYVRTQPNAARFNCTDTTTDRGLWCAAGGMPIGTEFVTVTVDLRLASGTSLGGSGVLLDWNGMSGGNRVTWDFAADVPAPVTGSWYRLAKVLRRPAGATGTQTGWTCYGMAQYSVTGTARAVKDISIDRLVVRSSSTAEIAAYNAASQATVTALTTTVNTKITTYYAGAAPTATAVGDLWVNTAQNNKISRWNGTSWVDLDLTTNAIQASKGGDLVTNGTGLLGNNTNFSQLTFDGTDAPTGASGSFTTTAYTAVITSDEYIPVDPNRRYKTAIKVRQQVAGTASNFYAGVAAYDAFNNAINPTMYCYDSNAQTTLAATLNPGATTVSLTAAGAAWALSSANYIGFWNYQDAGGRVWPQFTYTRLSVPYASVSGTTVTLSSPWTGPAMPAGTPVNRMWSGGSFIYCTAVNVMPTTTWTTYTGTITGLFNGASTGPNAATNSFPPGTAKVKILTLANYSVDGGRHAISAVSMSEAAAAQATADLALTSANGKNKVTYSTSLPGTTANSAGDVWFRKDASDHIIGHWEGAGGTSWISKTLSHEVISSVDVGALVAGSLVVPVQLGTGGGVQSGPSGARIAMDSTGFKAYDSGSVNTVAINADGTAFFKGAITSGSTITGATISTPTGSVSGQVYMDGDGFWNSSDGTTNLCPNPSFEAASYVAFASVNTSYTQKGAPITDFVGNMDLLAKYGATSLKVWNTVANGYVEVNIGVAQPSTTYTVSWHSATGKIDDTAVGLNNVQGDWANVGVVRTDTSAVIANGRDGYVILSGALAGKYVSALSTGIDVIGYAGWQARYWKTFTTPSNLPANTTLRLRLPAPRAAGNANEMVYAVNYDGAQLEAKPYMTRYCDGDQPDCSWSGTKHASTSSRQTTRGLWLPTFGDPTFSGIVNASQAAVTKIKKGTGALQGSNYIERLNYAVQSFSNATWTDVPYEAAGGIDRMAADDGTITGAGFAQFVARVAGMYTFNSTYTFSTNGTGVRGMRHTMNYNGTDAVTNHIVRQATDMASGINTVSLTTTCFLMPGWYLRAQVYQSAGGVLSGVAHSNTNPCRATFALIA